MFHPVPAHTVSQPTTPNNPHRELMVLRSQPPGAAAMLLIMLFPQDIARRPHSARCRPAVGVPQATSVMAVEARTSGLWGDLCPCRCSTECRIALVCIVSVQGVWDRREPIPRGAFIERALCAPGEPRLPKKGHGGALQGIGQMGGAGNAVPHSPNPPWP